MKISKSKSGFSVYNGQSSKWIWFAGPFDVLKKIKNLETGAEKLKVKIMKTYSTHPFCVERDVLFGSNNLAIMAAQGLNYTHINGTSVALKEAIQMEEFTAELEFVHETVGFRYIDEKLCFMNDSIVGELNPDELKSHNVGQSGVVKGGSFKGWREFVLNYIVKSPGLELALALAATSAVTFLLREQDVIEEVPLWCIVGESSTGKTTVLYLMASMWGKPRMLVRNFDTTESAFFKILEDLPGIPCLLDEATWTPEFDWNRLVYTLPSGRGRRRCQSDGSLRPMTEYSTSVILSSEQSILDKCEKIKGQYARMVELTIDWFQDKGDIVELVKPFANEHHGWAGEALARLLLAKGFEKKLAKKYKQYKKRRMTALGPDASNLEVRMAQRVALAEVSAWALEKAIKVDLHRVEMMKVLESAISHTLSEVPTAEDDPLYNVIAEEVMQHKSKFPDESELNAKYSSDLWGFRGVEDGKACVWILHKKFHEFLAMQSTYGPRQAYWKLHEAGHLKKFYKNRFSLNRTINGISALYLCFFPIDKGVTDDDVSSQANAGCVKLSRLPKLHSQVKNLLLEADGDED